MWLSDEIVEFTSLLDVKPSFPLPRLLATRIATSETFGILPIDTALASELDIVTLPPVKIEGAPHHRDLPVNTLCWLSTHPKNQYRFLQMRQHTLYPVLPVASHAEHVHFLKEINKPVFRKGKGQYPPHEAHKNINYPLFTKFWNGDVNSQDRTITDSNKRLYYKLPGQLEFHHKKVIAVRTERSTMYFGQNAVALQAFVDILTAEDNLVQTLPGIPLSLNHEPDEALRTGAVIFFT